MTRNHRLAWVALCVLGMLGAARPAFAQGAKPDAIALRAFGLFDAGEGTLEFWIKFGFEPLELHDGYLGRASVLNLYFGDPAFPRDSLTVSIGTKAVPRRTRTGMQCAARVGTVVNGIEIHHPGFPDFGQDVKRDTWYHFAITWSGEGLEYFVDGKSQGKSELFHPLAPLITTQALLYVGPVPRQSYSRDRVALDELRVSSTVRKTEELGFTRGQLRADPWTLLLLNFDNNAAEATTVQPAFSAVAAAAGPFPLPSRFRLVQGKFDRGLALSQDAFQEDKHTGKD